MNETRHPRLRLAHVIVCGVAAVMLIAAACSSDEPASPEGAVPEEADAPAIADTAPEPGDDTDDRTEPEPQPEPEPEPEPVTELEPGPESEPEPEPEQDAAVAAQDWEDAGVHQPAVDALLAWDVFDGTGCADGSGLCPDEPLRHWELAVWLVRVLDGEEPAEVAESRFADVDGDAWWAAHVERLVELQVAVGCAGEQLGFCPDQEVSRGQMAALVVRAFGLSEGVPSGFADVGADHLFADDIDAVVEARVAAGCTDDPLRFCPERSVTRGQMATFLARAVGLIEAPNAVSVSVGAVAAGGFHSCAVGAGGNLGCWGDDFFGQADAPVGGFVSVAGGEFHSCGLRSDGSVVCWGDNGHGQADAPAGVFESVSAGGFHSCGLRSDGSAVCWGDSGDGQADAPAGVFESVSAGGFHSCGLRSDGSVVCWGNNELRQSVAPGGVFSALSAGSTHSCGLTASGEAVCWGNDDDGQSTPVEGNYVTVSAGSTHSCGLTASGEAVCWGNDDDGQLQAPGNLGAAS